MDENALGPTFYVAYNTLTIYWIPERQFCKIALWWPDYDELFTGSMFFMPCLFQRTGGSISGADMLKEM